MAYARAARIDTDMIPIIDLAPLIDGSGAAETARRLHQASRDVGFIYVRNHGIPESLIEETRETALAFFRSGAENKADVAVTKKHRGFLGRGGAKMGDDQKADLKESFIWGYEDAAGNIPDDHPIRGANVWPADPPRMRDVAMAYFAAAHDVAHHLMRGFALGLDLEEDFFLRSIDRPISRASFVYYPPQPADLGEDQFGVGPHTDFGVLTVLCQDSVGGLQVQTLDGDWVAAPPIPGTLVVNVGDLLARWTGGAYRSTPHRVVNTSGRERLSLVLAYDPDPETIIDASDVFGPDHDAREAPITCGDYLVDRFARAFAYRNR